MPLNLRFRLRASSQNLSYPAESSNINPTGIQLTTEAPLKANMRIELWPEDEMGMHVKDYVEGTHYVHGHVSWIRKNKGNGKTTYGISFNRQIDWLIPMQALTKHLDATLNAINQNPPQTIAQVGKPLCLKEIEKQAIFDALQRNNWKRMKTCRELGISKDTLRRKISSYELLDTTQKRKSHRVKKRACPAESKTI